jgi:Pyridoxamine 5'-phosphate oxidase
VIEPTADRPYMPGYGVVGPSDGRGLLPWTWAEERLVRSHDYWLATGATETGPHLVPVWGVWREGAAWFSASPGSRKTRNLTADARAALATDDPRQPVVVRGAVERITDVRVIEQFTGWVNYKYESEIAVSFFTDNATFRLAPRWVFSLDEDDFTGTPTRWTFPT